jgi:hypothetical protein
MNILLKTITLFIDNILVKNKADERYFPIYWRIVCVDIKTLKQNQCITIDTH